MAVPCFYCHSIVVNKGEIVPFDRSSLSRLSMRGGCAANSQHKITFKATLRFPVQAFCCRMLRISAPHEPVTLHQVGFETLM